MRRKTRALDHRRLDASTLKVWNGVEVLGVAGQSYRVRLRAVPTNTRYSGVCWAEYNTPHRGRLNGGKHDEYRRCWGPTALHWEKRGRGKDVRPLARRLCKPALLWVDVMAFS